MKTLEEINFDLKEKKNELNEQDLSVFALNKRIFELLLEISELEKEKKELEEQA